MERDKSGRALVVGGDSLVGEALQGRFRELGLAVDATTRRGGSSGRLFLDLADPDFSPLARATYEVAFVCVAVTSMEDCQAKPEFSRRINVDNTLALLRRLADRGTHAVFLSSSQVFDGETPLPDEEAPTAPRNEYGAQKLAVEEAIAREALPVAVLRPTKVLPDRPVGVFDGWFRKLSQGEPTDAATNMALSPVTAADLADAAQRLGGGRHRGRWHLGARDEISYFDAARLMAMHMGVSPELVRSQTLTEGQVPAIYRPRHVALACGKIERDLGFRLRDAREVLDALFAGFPRPARAAVAGQ